LLVKAGDWGAPHRLERFFPELAATVRQEKRRCCVWRFSKQRVGIRVICGCTTLRHLPQSFTLGFWTGGQGVGYSKSSSWRNAFTRRSAMSVRPSLKTTTRWTRKTLQFTGRIPDCPPESGGQRDREAHPARGGSHWDHLEG